MNRNSTLPQLQKALADFVSVQSQSDGGYATVDSTDIGDMYDIIYTMIRLKYEQDPDGDYPIDVRLANRTKERFVSVPSIPYGHDVESPEELLKRGEKIYMITSAINELSSELSTYMNYRWKK